VAIGPFLRGGLERACFAGALLFFPILTGALLGLAGGGIAALAVRAPRALPLPGAAWRALWGALIGLLLAGWGLFALTLTIRFDGLIARGPRLIGATCAAGILCGLAWGPLAAFVGSRWTTATERARLGLARMALAAVIACAMIATYGVNTYFAPQSSYGVHVLLLTALAACAALEVVLMPERVRAPAGAIAVGLAAAARDPLGPGDAHAPAHRVPGQGTNLDQRALRGPALAPDGLGRGWLRAAVPGRRHGFGAVRSVAAAPRSCRATRAREPRRCRRGATSSATRSRLPTSAAHARCMPRGCRCACAALRNRRWGRSVRPRRTSTRSRRGARCSMPPTRPRPAPRTRSTACSRASRRPRTWWSPIPDATSRCACCAAATGCARGRTSLT
jgi:hypothetical protein